MSYVIFFEKPGCINNARQKALLESAGHRLVVRDLLSERWTAAVLRPFFGTMAVAEWFNRSAPAVKEGAVVPEALDEDAALALMVADPLLIRRPLMRVGSLEAPSTATDCGASRGVRPEKRLPVWLTESGMG